MLQRICDICTKVIPLGVDERDSRTQFFTVFKNDEEKGDICNECMQKLIKYLETKGVEE